MFQTSCNLAAIWGKSEVNLAHQRNHGKFALATKVAFKSATKTASKFACINGPLHGATFLATSVPQR